MKTEYTPVSVELVEIDRLDVISTSDPNNTEIIKDP